ncbi:MAG: hypothetical protein AAGE52_17250, partial [Myxococcota bacterium]
MDPRERVRQWLADAPRGSRNWASGGCTWFDARVFAVGFFANTDELLVLSHSASVVVAESGAQRLVDAEVDAVRLIATVDGQRVRIAGVSGGGLPRTTHDGWSVRVVSLDWPSEVAFLQPPGSHAWHGECVVVDESNAPFRAVGFSDTGTMLVVATDETVERWRRVPAKAGATGTSTRHPLETWGARFDP